MQATKKGNILVGRLMDKHVTRAGKARPLILLSIPLSILGLLVLFVISPYVNETMPWLFIGGETICYAAILGMFLFMNVERYSRLDHAAIRLDRDPDAEVEPIADDDTLKKFNEQRRKNGRPELKPGR